MFNFNFINSEVRSSFRMSTFIENLLKISENESCSINEDLFLNFCVDIEFEKNSDIEQYAKRFLTQAKSDNLSLIENTPDKKKSVNLKYNFNREIPNHELSDKETLHENLSFIYLHKMEKACEISFLYKILNKGLDYLSQKEIFFINYCLLFGYFNYNNKKQEELKISEIVYFIKKIRENNSMESFFYIAKNDSLYQSYFFLDFIDYFKNNNYQVISESVIDIFYDNLINSSRENIINTKIKTYNTFNDYLNTFLNYLNSTNLFVVKGNFDLKGNQKSISINEQEKNRFSFINDFTFEEREELLKNGEWSEYYYSLNKSFSTSIKEESQKNYNRKKFRHEIDKDKCFFDSVYEHHYVKDAHNNTLGIDLHHIIPMNNQQYFLDKYNTNIDVKDNLVPVCKNCHSYLHSKIDTFLLPLYESKKNNIKELSGNENVSFNKFKSFY